MEQIVIVSIETEILSYTASGEYTLEYLAVIDGTNSNCEYCV